MNIGIISGKPGGQQHLTLINSTLKIRALTEVKFILLDSFKGQNVLKCSVLILSHATILFRGNPGSNQIIISILEFSQVWCFRSLWANTPIWSANARMMVDHPEFPEFLFWCTELSSKAETGFENMNVLPDFPSKSVSKQ